MDVISMPATAVSILIPKSYADSASYHLLIDRLVQLWIILSLSVENKAYSGMLQSPDLLNVNKFHLHMV